MATTSTSIGSGSLGAWDLIAFSSDDASVSLFSVDLTNTSTLGTVSSTYLDDAQKALLKNSALSLIAYYGRANLVASATLAESFMRKIVGLVTMDAQPILSSTAIVADVATLSATVGGVARYFALYVPNAAGAGVFTGDGSGEASTPVGPASGDLSGNFPNPTVTGLTGNALPANVALGVLRRNAANNGWEEVTSVPPSGATGGILGYTGGTYPNPNGLAGNGSNQIPVKNAAGANVVLKQDDVAANASGIALQGGRNTAALASGGVVAANAGNSGGDGGDAYLVGGAHTGGGVDGFGASIVAKGGQENGAFIKGGNAEIDAGAGFSGGGDIVFGDVSAARFIFGSQSAAGTQNKPPFLTKSPVEEPVVAQSVAAGDTLGAGPDGIAGYYNIASAAAVTLGANWLPTPYNDLTVGPGFGQRAVIYNSGTFAITFPHSATYRLSGSADCVLAATGVLTMAYIVGVGWVETGRIATTG